MSDKTKKITTTVMATVIGASIAAASTGAIASSTNKNVEKCYGIAKAGKNDCGTAAHACAGQSKTDRDPSEWMFVMKGNCDKIAGGSLKPGNNDDQNADQS
jgi:uncharacterized membrane protein